MKRKFLFLILAGALMTTGLAACAPSSKKEESESMQAAGAYHKISAEEAKQKIEENSGMIIVDVRTPEEYAQEHIEGAINIPNEAITDKEPEQLPDKDARILVYCRSGVRSKQAADKLVVMGYGNVYDMGGINDWPYETVTE